MQTNAKKRFNKSIIIVYHHRYCENTDNKLLISHLLELKDMYAKRYDKVIVYLFSQKFVFDSNSRKVEFFDNRGIREFIFYTMDEWTGENDDIFWASCDDDLIKVLIDDMKNVIRNHESGKIQGVR